MEEKKFWYFGVYDRSARRVIWGKAHKSAEEALKANYNYILSHVGRQFIIQGFPQELNTSAPA